MPEYCPTRRNGSIGAATYACTVCARRRLMRILMIPLLEAASPQQRAVMKQSLVAAQSMGLNLSVSDLGGVAGRQELAVARCDRLLESAVHALLRSIQDGITAPETLRHMVTADASVDEFLGSNLHRLLCLSGMCIPLSPTAYPHHACIASPPTPVPTQHSPSTRPRCVSPPPSGFECPLLVFPTTWYIHGPPD